MIDNDPLRPQTTAEIDGEVIHPSHDSKTLDLITIAKQELADWHPQWGAKPEKDSRAEDKLAAMREDTANRLKDYLPHNLRDKKERIRNVMSLRDFCAKLHNILGPASDGGSRVFINFPPPHPSIDSRMKGLFIKMRGMDMFTFHTDLPPGWKKICAVQSPAMSEWGLMNLDDRGMFKSWKYVGWRGNVLLRLILAEAITKEEAHGEFGVPQGVEVDREYLKILEAFERGKRTN